MLRPGRTGRAVPRGYRVTPGRNGARARPFGSQPAIHLYVPHRFMANSDPRPRLRLHQNGPAVPGPSRRIPSRRAEQRASAPGAVASVSAYRGLSLRQVARRPCGSTPSGLIVSRRIPSITASTRARDRTEVRSGCGAIVPVRSTQSASMSAGRRDIARTYVHRGRLARPRATNRGVRITRELIAMGQDVQRGTPHPDLAQQW